MISQIVWKLVTMSPILLKPVMPLSWNNSPLLFSSFTPFASHSCMPSPLAPDPIRVQTCVCCLFLTNKNSLALTSNFLSISLSNQSCESSNQRYQYMEIFTSTETMVVYAIAFCSIIKQFLSLWHKFKFSNPFFCVTCWCVPFLFQYLIIFSNIIQRMKYPRSMRLGCKDIGIRKTQLLVLYFLLKHASVDKTKLKWRKD